MIHFLTVAYVASVVWAAPTPPSDCQSKLMIAVPESALVRHHDRFQSLLKRFVRITTEVGLNNGMTLQIASKEGFRNLPIIHPRALERRLRILVRSHAETRGVPHKIVEDWNQFDLRASSGGEGAGAADAADLFVEIGDWIPLKSREMALHTLNTYVAMSMAPYFRYLVVHVPIFDDLNRQSAEEHELKRQAFEEIVALQETGLDDEEVIRALKLPQVRFIATMLPLRLEHVTIVKSIGPKRGSPAFSAGNGFDISLFYSAL